MAKSTIKLLVCEMTKAPPSTTHAAECAGRPARSLLVGAQESTDNGAQSSQAVTGRRTCGRRRGERAYRRKNVAEASLNEAHGATVQ